MGAGHFSGMGEGRCRWAGEGSDQETEGEWEPHNLARDLVREFQWFRRGSTTRLLRHRTGTMLGTPAMATRANNRKTLHWRRRLHQSRPIGDGSACDAASVKIGRANGRPPVTHAQSVYR